MSSDWRLSESSPKKAFLKAYKRAHRVKTLVCTLCAKTFNSKSELDTHVRMHTGEKKFKCTQCEKTFNQSPHLRTHLDFHAGVRRFTCEECNKSFTQSSHLKTHKKTLVEWNFWNVNIAANNLPWKILTLTLHTRVHTGEKPNSCTKCEMAFSQQHELKHTQTNILEWSSSNASSACQALCQTIFHCKWVVRSLKNTC